MSTSTEQLCLEPVAGEQCQLLKGHLVPCSADPDGGWITVPTEPFSQILPNLWQGGVHYQAPHALNYFDAVLSLAPGGESPKWPTEQRRFLCQDGPDLPDPEGLRYAVEWAYGQWKRGRRTLVRCQAGLNRSGLVIALMLYKDGYPIDDAIDIIRRARSPYALCNTRFVDYLQQLP